MDVMEAIFTRRSIREYTDAPISPEDINELLKAAMAAPSAHDAQPWHFIIIEDHQILDKIPETHPHAAMLLQAQLAIAICGDTQVQPDGWMVDCATAAQNILLAAHAKGLGAVYVGIYPIAARMQELKDLLNLPKYILPLALISVGHPKKKKASVDHYNPVKIHWDRW